MAKLEQNEDGKDCKDADVYENENEMDQMR